MRFDHLRVEISLQSVTKYLTLTLVFASNGALRKKSNLYFSRVFCYDWQNFHFGWGTAHWGIVLSSVETFLIFPNFLSRSGTREATRIYYVYR